MTDKALTAQQAMLYNMIVEAGGALPRAQLDKVSVRGGVNKSLTVMQTAGFIKFMSRSQCWVTTRRKPVMPPATPTKPAELVKPSAKPNRPVKEIEETDGEDDDDKPVKITPEVLTAFSDKGLQRELRYATDAGGKTKDDRKWLRDVQHEICRRAENKTKPNIDEVLDVFNTFRNDSATLTNRYAASQWSAKIAEFQAELRAGLEKLGLAQHIDWTAPEDMEEPAKIKTKR